jgi:hypothetical protein
MLRGVEISANHGANPICNRLVLHVTLVELIPRLEPTVLYQGWLKFRALLLKIQVDLLCSCHPKGTTIVHLVCNECFLSVLAPVKGQIHFFRYMTRLLLGVSRVSC